jgi:hypothetical protein
MRSELPAVALLFAAACGTGAPSPQYESALLTLHGVVTGTSPGRDAQVGLVWRHPADGRLLRGATVPLSLRSPLPVRFALDITAPPPPEAMTSPASGVHAAIGALVITVDLETEQLLDLSTVKPNVDRVLGTPIDLSLLYVETDDANAKERGFHLLRQASRGTGTYDPWLAQGVAQDAPELLPADTELTVPLSTDPQLTTAVCLGLAASVTPAPPADPCPGGVCPGYDLAGAAVDCASDGRSFTATVCPGPGTLCERNGCAPRSGTWPIDSPRPMGWPCP